MNRRDFFHPRRLARALDDLRSPGPDLPAFQAETALLRFSRRAMATSFEVLVSCVGAAAQQAAEAALDEIDRLEAQLTVFREDSEVSRLNRLAPYGPVGVEPGLFALLEMAERISRETEGAFDISTGALTKTWGFFRRQGRVPEPSELAEALARVGQGQVVLDPGRHSVHFRRRGLEINLGSIGKGYALDRAAAVMRAAWGPEGSADALLHGGHSSVLAVGNEPGRRDGWLVGLRHPWDPERRLGLVRLWNQGLGTSAATYQHIEYRGRKLGHILDPRTGWPAEGITSASVVAPTAAEADALATAFYTLGVEGARAYCASHPEIGAVLLPEGDDTQPVVLGPVALERGPEGPPGASG
jgi:thiamine biosynthesis lipoprotein